MTERDDGYSLYDKVVAGTAAVLPAVLVGVFLEALLPGGTGLFGGVAAWYLVTKRLLSERRPSGEEDVPGDPEAAGLVWEVESELDGLAADAPDGELPVARGIHDRARRYLDHGAYNRARRTAERARRVGEEEAVVRAVVAAGEAVRGQVAAIPRMEELLREAEEDAGTDPERAGELVGDARGIAHRLVDDLRDGAGERAESARRAAARGDHDRAEELWSEAYEVATAALDIALDGPAAVAPDAAGNADRRRTGREGTDPQGVIEDDPRRGGQGDRRPASGYPPDEGTAPADRSDRETGTGEPVDAPGRGPRTGDRRDGIEAERSHWDPAGDAEPDPTGPAEREPTGDRNPDPTGPAERERESERES
ncbi:hypothetical protein BRD00_11680 [Halobacteriales archaeon QS_8_69_26]|nr:MAG: hypothetical protein BRD00_11680 [Halobacteriales archaeon QS_8_69_26]